MLHASLLGEDWLAPLRGGFRDDLIVVDSSTFGRLATGAAPAPFDDLLSLASGALLSLNSTRPCDPTSTPLRYRGELASVHAALAAVMGVIGSLFERRETGRGQLIDVSGQAAVAGIIATAIASWTYSGLQAAHDGRRGVAPWGFYACCDGSVLVQVSEDVQYRGLLKVLGNPDWGGLEIFATNALRIEVMDVLGPLVAEAIAPFSTDDFLDTCRAGGVAAARIHTARDLLEWEQLAAHQYFQPISIGDSGSAIDVLVPTAPWRFHGTAPAVRTPPPTLDSGVEWPPVDRMPVGHVPVGAVGWAPLAGVKVVDLTWVWAGPYAAMQFAHLGAEVIKVESSVRLDVTRRLGPWADDEPAPDRSGYFNQYNQGKQSVTLDLKHPQGLELLEGLIREADIVIDNMRAGTLPAWVSPTRDCTRSTRRSWRCR